MNINKNHNPRYVSYEVLR